MEYIKKLNRTGPCEIDEDKVVSDWKRMPHLWSLSQWHHEFRMVRQLQKNSGIYVLKVDINKSQAQRLIKALRLQKISSPVFKCGASWKILTEEDNNG